jgi:uncharacterized peroxidase-related enzyme
MPRIAPLDPSHADASTAATLAAVQAKLGRVPNLLRTLAHSPTALQGYLAFGEIAATGHLDARQREIVALAVAQANRCEYCLAAHTAIGRGAGLDATAIEAARRGDGATPADAALATFARRVVEQRGRVDDAALAALAAAGHGPGIAIEIVALVAINTLTNYANHVAGTDVDFPAVALDPAA